MHYLSQSDKVDMHQRIIVVYICFKFHEIPLSG